MGCNIPRPWKRPPTPPIYEPPKMPKTAPAKMNDQPYGSKTNEAVRKAFDQFHKAAQDMTYHDTDLDKPRKEHVTNCPNCCAVITGPICEYCGTRFPDLESHYQVLRTTDNQEIIIPIYIGGDKIDEVVTRNRTQFRSGDCSGSPGTTTQLR